MKSSAEALTKKLYLTVMDVFDNYIGNDEDDYNDMIETLRRKKMTARRNNENLQQNQNTVTTAKDPIGDDAELALSSTTQSTHSDCTEDDPEEFANKQQQNQVAVAKELLETPLETAETDVVVGHDQAQAAAAAVSAAVDDDIPKETPARESSRAEISVERLRGGVVDVDGRSPIEIATEREVEKAESELTKTMGKNRVRKSVCVCLRFF